MSSLLLERCNLLEARGDPSVVLQPNNQLQEDLCNLLAPCQGPVQQELREDETIGSSFESTIVLWSLEKIDPRLPARVAKLYGHQMTGIKTLVLFS